MPNYQENRTTVKVTRLHDSHARWLNYNPSCSASIIATKYKYMNWIFYHLSSGNSIKLEADPSHGLSGSWT